MLIFSDLLLEHQIPISENTEQTISDVSLSKITEAAEHFASSLNLVDANTHLERPLDSFSADTCNSQVLSGHISESSTVKEHIEKAKSVIERFDAAFGRKEGSFHEKSNFRDQTK